LQFQRRALAPGGIPGRQGSTCLPGMPGRRAPSDLQAIDSDHYGLPASGTGDDVIVRALAELGGQEREHRPHALAAGLIEVAAGRIGHGIGHSQLAGKVGIDPFEARLDGTQ